MSKSRSGPKTPPCNKRATKKGDGTVGYCRPPKQHQFRSGRSGNPKGRPRGSKNEATILREIMTRNIEIREGGRARKISVLAAILLRFAESALKGDAKSAAFLLNRYGAVKGADEAPESNQDDQEILAAFVKTVEHRLKTKRRKT